MTIDSHMLNELLEWRRQRYGLPCRVEVSEGWGCLVAEVWYRDVPTDKPIERILI